MALLLATLALSAQEYDVLKNRDGILLYSDDDGKWLSRQAWHYIFTGFRGSKIHYTGTMVVRLRKAQAGVVPVF